MGNRSIELKKIIDQRNKGRRPGKEMGTTLIQSKEDTEIDKTLHEIIEAVNTLKNRNAAGVDTIHAEILKRDVNITKTKTKV